MIAIHSPWQTAVPRIARAHRHWLVEAGSLTQKLKSHCQHFSVLRIHQKHAPLQLSEHHCLNLARARHVLQRQVLLLCDGVPTVFAHTVTDAQRVTRDWPFFNSLGNKSLGVSLFSNPLIHRIAFEYTRLSPRDALYQATVAGLKQMGADTPQTSHLWARRSIFSHHRYPHSRMMVTEVMLPSVYRLNAQTFKL